MDTSPKTIADMLVTKPEKAAECPEHGGYMSRNIIGRVWSGCPPCEATQQAIRDEERRVELARIAEQQHRAMLAQASIPARFVGRTFDNFVADTDEKRHALTVARDFAEQFAEHSRRGAVLILSGKPGTGKSHLAASILQTLLAKRVCYMTCLDLIRSVRETWRKDSEHSESRVLGYLEQLDLLVIDEVGMQYGTEGEQTILFDVLDRRYREIKPTILITNQEREGFKGFVGERTFDRLRETSRWVAFEWPSYRPQARKEAAA